MSCGIVQNCGVDLRLPAALQRRSVCQNYEVQHVGRTYVGESVGRHCERFPGESVGDCLCACERKDVGGGVAEGDDRTWVWKGIVSIVEEIRRTASLLTTVVVVG